MPGKHGLAAKSGERMLDSIDLRRRLLSYLREGKSRKDACALIDIDPGTLFRYNRDHPEFLAEIRDAEAEVVEDAYAVFIEIMNDPDASASDRIRAADALAKYKARDQKSDHKIIEHRVELVGGDQLAEVVELQRKVEERRALEARTIDVESEEQ